MELEGDELVDPHPDITALFVYYNGLYFQHKLGACTVQWSSPRMTLCAGICKYSYSGGCEIRLSEPLLKYRTVSDIKNTLLHEMIHAFLFLTNGNKNHDDHGHHFQSKMKDINESHLPDFERPPEGYRVTIYHNFRDEVDNYRVHQWQCQSCGNMVKRAMNRPPSASDCVFRRQPGPCSHPRCLWHMHERTCGGSYVKVAEPAGYKDKRKKPKVEESTCSKDKECRKSTAKAMKAADNFTITSFFSMSEKAIEKFSGSESSRAVVATETERCVKCPNCNKVLIGIQSTQEFNMELNRHLDICLS